MTPAERAADALLSLLPNGGAALREASVFVVRNGDRGWRARVALTLRDPRVPYGHEAERAVNGYGPSPRDAILAAVRELPNFG